MPDTTGEFAVVQGKAVHNVDEIYIYTHARKLEYVENAVYRLYNNVNSHHMWTSSYKEANILYNRKHEGEWEWTYEGVAWIQGKDEPTQRYYNPNNGDHIFTLDDEEATTLYSLGWNSEGTDFKNCEGGSPVYRLYNPETGLHLYTADTKERDELVLLGWKNEGAKVYAKVESLQGNCWALDDIKEGDTVYLESVYRYYSLTPKYPGMFIRDYNNYPSLRRVYGNGTVTGNLDTSSSNVFRIINSHKIQESNGGLSEFIATYICMADKNENGAAILKGGSSTVRIVGGYTSIPIKDELMNIVWNDSILKNFIGFDSYSTYFYKSIEEYIKRGNGVTQYVEGSLKIEEIAKVSSIKLVRSLDGKYILAMHLVGSPFITGADYYPKNSSTIGITDLFCGLYSYDRYDTTSTKVTHYKTTISDGSLKRLEELGNIPKSLMDLNMSMTSAIYALSILKVRNPKQFELKEKYTIESIGIDYDIIKTITYEENKEISYLISNLNSYKNPKYFHCDDNGIYYCLVQGSDYDSMYSPLYDIIIRYDSSTQDLKIKRLDTTIRISGQIYSNGLIITCDNNKLIKAFDSDTLEYDTQKTNILNNFYNEDPYLFRLVYAHKNYIYIFGIKNNLMMSEGVKINTRTLSQENIELPVKISLFVSENTVMNSNFIEFSLNGKTYYYKSYYGGEIFLATTFDGHTYLIASCRDSYNYLISYTQDYFIAIDVDDGYKIRNNIGLVHRYTSTSPTYFQENNIYYGIFNPYYFSNTEWTHNYYLEDYIDRTDYNYFTKRRLTDKEIETGYYKDHLPKWFDNIVKNDGNRHSPAYYAYKSKPKLEKGERLRVGVAKSNAKKGEIVKVSCPNMIYKSN